MQIRVLGPVEIVADDGRLLSLPCRQKAVVALLAMNAGSALTADRIVDELWDEPPGPTALAFHDEAAGVELGKLDVKVGPGEFVVSRPITVEMPRQASLVFLKAQLRGQPRSPRPSELNSVAGLAVHAGRE